MFFGDATKIDENINVMADIDSIDVALLTADGKKIKGTFGTTSYEIAPNDFSSMDIAVGACPVKHDLCNSVSGSIINSESILFTNFNSKLPTKAE